MISKDGYVLTNNHVVEGAKKITVRLADGRHFKGRIIGRDPRTDIAVIKVDGKNLPAAQFGDSSAIRAGDWAVAIGNPLGFGNSVTVGVISATKRTDLPVGPGKVLAEAIQTDAAINRGNSGGALANIDGQLIGINTAIYSTEPGQGSIGIGFAIPSNTARRVAKELIEKGRIVRPWLGVQLAGISGDLAAWYEQHGYKSRDGAVVMQTIPDSPAAKKGLMQGDVITQIDDKKVANPEGLVDQINKHKVGAVVKLSIWRMGRSQMVVIKLEEMPLDAG
jgi:S1-C subfamily serine protease